jgi:putative membrane protein
MWLDHGWHMGWMFLWWVLGFAVLAWLVGLIVRAGAGPAAHGGEAPEVILKRRYARGDVDHEEYERRLSDLRK